MTPDKDHEEITIEVRPSSEGQKPTKQDLEQAIHQKLQTDPTQLFVHGNTVFLKCENVGGKRGKGGKGGKGE